MAFDWNLTEEWRLLSKSHCVICDHVTVVEVESKNVWSFDRKHLAGMWLGSDYNLTECNWDVTSDEN